MFIIIFFFIISKFKQREALLKVVVRVACSGPPGSCSVIVMCFCRYFVKHNIGDIRKWFLQMKMSQHERFIPSSRGP